MGVSHLTVNFRLGRQSRHRVNDNDIDRARADHRLTDLEGLLAGIRLGNIQVVDIDTDILRVDGIERVLRVDKARYAAPLLNLRNHVERDCRLSA